MANSMEQQKRDSAQPSAESALTEKTCVKCKAIKPVSDFYNCKRASDGKKSECKICSRNRKRKTNRAYISDLVPDGFCYCQYCGKTKLANTDNFYSSKITELSKILVCKECRRKKNRRNANAKREEAKERHKKWREENRDKIRVKNREWKKKNKRKVKEYSKKYQGTDAYKKARLAYNRKYYKENRIKMCAKSCAYDSRVRISRPVWESQSKINEYYRMAKDLGLEVDHIVPINSELVCGLHCVDNFQMLTRSENASKGNRFWPYMPEEKNET